MVFLGNPEYACDLQPIDFAAVARGFGVASFTIDDPNKCGATLDQALAVNGPVLIEAVVDPNTPPMPAKVKPEQAIHLAEALIRGTRDASGILRAARPRGGTNWKGTLPEPPRRVGTDTLKEFGQRK
jgi:pyruvate dehydrogenase (quinone)/pyruvate oxidase